MGKVRAIEIRAGQQCPVELGSRQLDAGEIGA
jgi:hypothetical protein